MKDRNLEEETQLAKIEEFSPDKMSLEQQQQAAQLYHQLGLDPVVNKVLKEFPESLSGMDKFTDKVLGPYDVKGRADAVARTTALVTYAALSQEHHKQMGKLKSQLASAGKEQDRIKSNYDNLVQKVAAVVGGDYEELKGNYSALVNKLAEVEQLKATIGAMQKERAQLTRKYDSQTRSLEQLKTVVETLDEAIPCGEIEQKLGKEQYAFLLKDSRIPRAVIDGVAKFIDIQKYLGIAAGAGAREACLYARKTLGASPTAAEQTPPGSPT